MSPRLPVVRRTRTAVVVSLSGSMAPALIGLLGTLIASTRIDRQSEVVALLTIWTILGYLSLSDFGLSRTSTRLTTGVAASEARLVVARVWKPAIFVGGAMACGLAAVLGIFASALHLKDATALWLLVIVPPVAALQFPVVGFLEAQGRWLTIACNRVSVATYTYLAPALLLAAGFGINLVVVVVVVGRCLSFVALTWSAGVRWPQHTTSASAGVHIASVLTWVGVSSVIGPALLYLDRLVLAMMPVDVDQWTFYVFVSEVALKTYVIPSAVISVLYPWLLRNISARAVRLRRLMSWRLVGPILALVGTVVALVSIAIPEGTLAALGLSVNNGNSGRMILGVLIGSTILNWTSQLWIAVLHATDGQRKVVSIQLALAAPYGVALVGSWFAGSAVAVAVAFGLRIAGTWALLHWQALRAVVRTMHGASVRAPRGSVPER